MTTNSNSKFLAVILILFIAYPVFSQKPTIEFLDRKIGPVGMTVAISGSGFSNTPAQLKVFFDAMAGQIISSTENLIECRGPLPIPIIRWAYAPAFLKIRS